MSRNLVVAKTIQKELSVILQEKINADLGVVSVARVEVTNDLSHAKIYLSFFGKNRTDRFERIEKAKGFIRTELAHVLKMRHVPDLHFVNDYSLEEGDRIINKINQLNIPDAE